MKAVIFDLDGTLFDTREAVFTLFEQLSEEYDGRRLTREEIAAAMHARTHDITRTLINNTEVPFADIQKRHDELRLASMGTRLLYPGAPDLLRILRRLGYRLGALTSGMERTLTYLDDHGIRQHFDIIIAGDHVANPKPDPEGAQRIMAELGVEPNETVIVGDMVADILTAKNAGLGRAIGVSHGFGSAEALLTAGADLVVDDIPGILGVIE